MHTARIVVRYQRGGLCRDLTFCALHESTICEILSLVRDGAKANGAEIIGSEIHGPAPANGEDDHPCFTTDPAWGRDCEGDGWFRCRECTRHEVVG